MPTVREVVTQEYPDYASKIKLENPFVVNHILIDLSESVQISQNIFLLKIPDWTTFDLYNRRNVIIRPGQVVEFKISDFPKHFFLAQPWRLTFFVDFNLFKMYSIEPTSDLSLMGKRQEQYWCKNTEVIFQTHDGVLEHIYNPKLFVEFINSMYPPESSTKQQQQLVKTKQQLSQTRQEFGSALDVMINHVNDLDRKVDKIANTMTSLIRQNRIPQTLSTHDNKIKILEKMVESLRSLKRDLKQKRIIRESPYGREMQELD